MLPTNPPTYILGIAGLRLKLEVLCIKIIFVDIFSSIL